MDTDRMMKAIAYEVYAEIQQLAAQSPKEHNFKNIFKLSSKIIPIYNLFWTTITLLVYQK